VANDYPRVLLGSVVTNLDSRRVPVSVMERRKRQGPYPYYGATGVMDHVDDFLFEGLHLLIAEDGSVETRDGRPVLQLVDGKFWVNNHAHVLRGATDDDTRYLYYALQAVQIRPFMSGSVQAKLSQGNLNRIEVPYPHEGVRKGIAAVLGLVGGMSVWA
jgi:type I restriction enzyme, S subunit